MAHATGTYLDRILKQTRQDVATRKNQTSPSMLAESIATQSPAVDVIARLRQPVVSIIAEFKRASPSRGAFTFEGGPVEVASDYIAGGVAGISCLTDAPFFQGSLHDLDQVVAIAHTASEPVAVLRKDFMIDPFQIEEARAHGADCILLIVAALDNSQLQEFRLQAESLGMSSLVEVHDEQECERALTSGAKLLGINNRDLRTFEVSLETTERIARNVPVETTLVAESGIFTREDVHRMNRAGAHAVLIGESLITQPNRVQAVQNLTGVAR